MLGLGSSCNSEEGYAKGERYRERWKEPVETYHVTANPIGHDGYNYIGDFSNSTDADNWYENSASTSITLGNLVVTANSTTATNNWVSVSFRVTPNVSYTLSITVVSIDAGNRTKILIGTTQTNGDIFDTSATTNVKTYTSTFNSGDNKSLYLTLYSWSNTKKILFDSLTLKEA
tara:strand:- start:13367 stop:13888 length:522 start_codon:yes stop_codon:yes gene_type:complete